MPAKNVEHATLILALEELDVSLDQLAALFDDEDNRARSDLQRLDEDLVRLDEMLARSRDQVDLFHVLKLHSDEQFHSNLLAWLLDPKGTHGLGDHFLQDFLIASRAPRAISTVHRPHTTVLRENHIVLDDGRGRLDIRILNENAPFLCAIQNKVRASETGDQLSWYRSVLEHDYPDHGIHLVFLTPQGGLPNDPKERDHWTPMSYTKVLELVDTTLAAHGNAINDDVAAFLRQYAITLRRNIVPDISNDVHALARRIYRKHKPAIDLIIEHRDRYEPNYVNEGFRMIREAVSQQPLWVEGTINHPYARFVSVDWQEYADQLSLDDWPYSIMQFNIHVTNRTAGLSLFLACSDDDALRQQIFNGVRDNPDIFNCSLTEYTDEFITLHTVGNILDETDYDNWWDEEAIRSGVASRLDEFARGGFPAINRILLECLNQYCSQDS